MITIDASFWQSVGVESFNGNANGNQKDFYNSMVVNGVAVNNQYDFFQNSTFNGVVYYNQFDWYRAIGTFYSEPIYDQYSFYQNVTFDGVNAVGNQHDFFKGLTEICRYFTTLDGVADYYTIPTVTLAGDFVINVKFSTLSNGKMILGKSDNNNGWLYLLSSTSLRFKTNLATNRDYVGIPAMDDGKLHSVEVVRVGTSIELFVDGISYGSQTDSGDYVFNEIGHYNGGAFFDGIESDVSIIDGTVSTTTPIRDYRINEDLSATSTIIDYGSDGSNGTAVSITSSDEFCLNGINWVSINDMVTNGNFSVDANWTKGTGTTISGDKANFVNSGTNSLYQNVGLSTNTYYFVSSEISNFLSGGLRVYVGGNVSPFGIYNADSNFKTILNSTVSNGNIIFADGAFTGSMDNVSVKKMIQVSKPNIYLLGDSFVVMNDFTYNLVNNGTYNILDYTFDGVGSSTLADQKIRFDGATTSYGDTLIIMDGGLTDSAAVAISSIDAMVAHLTHDRWVWVQPSPAEDAEGSAARILWDAKVATIKAHVGVDHYVECLTELKAANNGSAGDLADVANNIVPRSLRTDSIHESSAGGIIRTRLISNFIKTKGW